MTEIDDVEPVLSEDPLRWGALMLPALSNITAPPDRRVAMVPPFDGSAMPAAMMAALNRIDADRFSTRGDRDTGAHKARPGKRYNVANATKTMATLLRIARLQLGARGPALDHLYDAYATREAWMNNRIGAVSVWAENLRRAYSHLPLFKTAKVTQIALARSLRHQIGDPAGPHAAARLLGLHRAWCQGIGLPFGGTSEMNGLLGAMGDFSKHSDAQIKATLRKIAKTAPQGKTSNDDIGQFITPIFAEVSDVLAPIFPIRPLAGNVGR
ncbi:hypothetical protein [Palleronia abyssalis]|uniref:Uncharacterized protein n=1 Tax=Palleronia abyssalis TaxID=1501240 RepID=A0A2R8BZB9_9RHOB|nr:hypothetical protein [Palleronia abyssalis]SPJ25521.1 hypothetical protein PAA8504_03372 [Palleronia abyssalis]